MAPVLFRHPSSLQHDPGPHPERPARITAIEQALEAQSWLGYDRRESPEAPREALAAVHPDRHLNGIQELCASGGGWIDQDTAVSEGSWEAAVRSAGGAVAMVDALLGGEAPVGASLHRPPGHHCEPARAMGFCLLSTIAIAARRARDAHGVERVLVLDWDVHHGNGTEAVFLADPGVLFASIHERPLYPGTGAAEVVGVGEGEGTTLNLPVPGGSGDDVFCSLVADVVAPAARAYAPGLVLVSAGFDAHADDPLAGCTVSDDGFAGMAATVRDLAGELGVPVGLVLEGGYDLGALSRGVVASLGALADAGVAAPDVPEHPLAAQALERLRRVGRLAV